MVAIKFNIAHSKYVTVAYVCNLSHANKRMKMPLYEVVELPPSMQGLEEFY